MSAAAAAQPASRIGIERALYRPEVFQYQRSLALGEPVDERALATLWCALPAALLLVISWLFVTATYQPRVTGTASRADGPDITVRYVTAAGGALADVHAGDEATIRIAGGAPHRMTVHRSDVAPCEASRRCVVLAGGLDAQAAAPALLTGAAVPAEVALSARAVIQ